MVNLEKDSFGRDGFNIYEITQNVWVFEVINGQSLSGSLQEVIVFAMNSYAFTLVELEASVEAMAKNNHNAAHFGMWASFIYSFNKSFQKQSVNQ